MFRTIIRLGKPAIVVLVTSVLWILLCTVYVLVTIGRRDIFTLPPHELGSVFTKNFTPLVFLWLALAYVSRGMVTRKTTKNMVKELEKLRLGSSKPPPMMCLVGLRKPAPRLSVCSRQWGRTPKPFTISPAVLYRILANTAETTSTTAFEKAAKYSRRFGPIPKTAWHIRGRPPSKFWSGCKMSACRSGTRPTS